MMQKQKEESKALVRVLCMKCGKVTPHTIEEREVGCGHRISRVGICVFCNEVRLLPLTMEIEKNVSMEM